MKPTGHYKAMNRRPHIPICAALLAFGIMFPAMAPADQPLLTMQAAVALAIKNNPKLKASRDQMKANIAQLTSEEPAFIPDLTIEAKGMEQGPRVTFPRGATGSATVLPRRYGKVEARLEQPIFQPSVWAANRRFRNEKEASRLDYEQAVQDTVWQVRQDFIQLWVARSMLGVTQDALKLAKEHFHLVQKVLLPAGTVSQQDELQAEAEVADANQSMIKAQNGVMLAEGELNRSLGRPISTPIGPIASPTLPPSTPSLSGQPPDTVEKLVQRALQNRPEIKGLRDHLSAASAGIQLASTESSPTLSLEGRLLTQTPSAFEHYDYGSLGLKVTWPLLDGGKSHRDRLQAIARRDQLNELLKDAELGITLQVRKAVADQQEAAERFKWLDKEEKLGEQVYKVALLRLEAHSATEMEVANARLQLTKVQTEMVQTQGDLALADVELDHAIGDGAAAQ
ncbi:MAG: TolC family protein [Armatimonadetes bacterium]|nr:TolC family protein [Armatimonadota bacterium]